MTAKHRSVVVEAVMRTPISMSDPIHLDGLLLAAREKRFGLESRGRPLDCVAWENGFHRCSASFLVSDELGGVGSVRTNRVARLDMKSRDGELYEPPTGAAKMARKYRDDVIGGLSPYRGVTRDFDVVTGVGSMVWQAFGDPDAMLDLLEEIRCVGRMHTTGWGQVEEWRAHGSDAAEDLCGVVAGGEPIRNLPASSASRYGLAEAGSSPGRIEPPYGGRDDLQPVLAPRRSLLSGTTQAARSLFEFAA